MRCPVFIQLLSPPRSLLQPLLLLVMVVVYHPQQALQHYHRRQASWQAPLTTSLITPIITALSVE